MSRRHLLAILVLTMPRLLWPGSAGADSDLPIRFHRLMLEDGLSQSSIVSLHQDGRGFIWTAETGMLELEGLANGTNRASVCSADGSLIATREGGAP